MCVVFVFNVTATTEIYTYGHTLSRHDALPIWQGDAYVAATRPDVQRVWLDPEAAVGGGRYFEFLVAVAEPFGALAEFTAFRHPPAQLRAPAGAPQQRGDRVHGPAAAPTTARSRQRRQ